ncbi:ATP-grasp domain-containing protein [Hymenobacter ruricola]|uniref:ATP-grasp domain-containing protein n=1 Tax=Hymenobacter ruricola TaxID=2791023 RepID=A0ABS0I9H6_9BACT|nr:ATP-grasp domain-containing protein [Hymenobacter ruricola]MBF9223590.1 ATP-grasp domain-containing protein [Hymenobacter ruricola]
MLNILLPSLPYQRAIDPMWQDEMEAAQRHGHTVCLYDAERNKLYQQPNAQWPTLYRGWMLTADEYEQLEQLTPLLVPAAMYLASHQAPGWYAAVAEFTPRSQVVQADAAEEVVAALLRRDGRCFVKGLSKSFGEDSVIHSPEELRKVLGKHLENESQELFVREFVELSDQPEQRFFAVRNRAFGANGREFPSTLLPALAALQSRWLYTVDVAHRPDGQPLIIEVGDGQVSDTKEWTPAELYQTALQHLAESTRNSSTSDD